MNILIKFSDSWENSFLSGDITDQTGERRKYIGSGASGFENYKNISLSKNTVMGILYRLIGEQRKMVDISKDRTSYFYSLEKYISFKESIESLTEDVVYLRNIEGADDKNGFSGPKLIEKTDLFSEKYFDRIWSPIVASPDTLENFLLNDIDLTQKLSLEKDRTVIGDIIGNLIEKNKSYDGLINYKNLEQFNVNSASVLKYLVKNNYISQEDSEKGLSYKIMVYCSIYKIIYQIVKEDFSFEARNLSKSGNISGLAKRSFTPKDFISATGKKKKVIGNPSKWEGYLTMKDGKKKKTTYFLKRKNGELLITIDISLDKQKELVELIENAGVGPFFVGKKGLAYVEAIW